MIYGYTQKFGHHKTALLGRRSGARESNKYSVHLISAALGVVTDLVQLMGGKVGNLVVNARFQMISYMIRTCSCSPALHYNTESRTYRLIR